MTKKAWRWTAALVFGVMLVFNGLAGGTTLLNGRNTAAVSDAYPTLFTPAGFTFAIWGVIYFLAIGFVLYQLGWLGKISGEKDKAITKITPYFVALSLANTAWTLAWQYDVIWLSVILTLTMLVMLVKITNILYKLNYTVREKWLMKMPFSIYFGWLTVATVANISVWLVSIQWDAWGVNPSSWLIAILWIAAAIGVTASLKNKDWLYSSVFLWAYTGILVKHLSAANAWQNDSNVVANLLMLVVAFAGLTGYLYRVHKETAK